MRTELSELKHTQGIPLLEQLIVDLTREDPKQRLNAMQAKTPTLARFLEFCIYQQRMTRRASIRSAELVTLTVAHPAIGMENFKTT